MERMDEMMERMQIYDCLQASSTMQMKIPNDKVGATTFPSYTMAKTAVVIGARSGAGGTQVCQRYRRSGIRTPR